jgi:hypothetical protein
VTRLLLPLLGKIALLCVLALGAVRFQPRNDAAVHALLSAPDGCAAPCLLGIRPGETTHEQAVAVLSAHPLIDHLEEDATGISWQWISAPQLGSLPDGDPSLPIFGRIDFYDGRVRSIHMETSLKWGDFLLLFGEPDQVILQNVNAPTVRYRIANAVYRSQNFEVQTMTRCPITSTKAIWYSTVYMIWPVSDLFRGGQSEQFRSC